MVNDLAEVIETSIFMAPEAKNCGVRQGLYWYDCIPTLRVDWHRTLMIAFERIVREHAVFREIFGII